MFLLLMSRNSYICILEGKTFSPLMNWCVTFIIGVLFSILADTKLKTKICALLQ